MISVWEFGCQYGGLPYNPVVNRFSVKVAGVSLLVVLLGALLVVLSYSSQERARLRYCQNNCRELGRIGANEVFFGPGFETDSLGRHFWQEIRVLSYRIDSYKGTPDPAKESPEECRVDPCREATHRHEWKPLLQETHPFLCPVYGKTLFAPGNPESIDYRGPKIIPEMRKGRIILGADREGNHPGGGGFVIFADSSVADRRSQVEKGSDGSSLWREAAQSLRD